MNYSQNINEIQYLNRFDQILNTMAYKMLTHKTVGNITIDYIDCMIPHHEAAILMCKNLLQYTTYTPLIKLAQNIITTQTKGIEQMKYIAKTTPNIRNTNEDVQNYINRYFVITDMMI